MATVTGKTSEKIDELVNASVVSGSLGPDGALTLTTRGGTVMSVGSVSDSVVGGHVDVNNHLILTTRVGATIDAGVVTRPPLDAWPIGSIFMTMVATNPATLLGGGTWIRFAKGRMPISLDESDVQFDTPGEVGGEKTHQLSVSEMPAHNHTIPNHIHGIPIQYTTTAALNNANTTKVTDINGSTGGGGNGLTPNTSLSGGGGATSTMGGNIAHNNMPPFVAVYMWQRTA